ncbi:MAG: hypothetical protein NTX65_14070 [Ignavibacteriales bacterium]|nr:hypothetical protein [Ignavibacteriales bacterium]
MASEQFELFVILLKLKSYLISLLDDPSLDYNSFDYTEEYLLRKYPDRKEEVLGMLMANKIESDAQIAFSENIQQKFKEIVIGLDSPHKLSEILDKFQIEAINDTLREKTLDDIKLNREQKLKEIVSVLLQLARIWTRRNEIENNIEDFSLLDEEEVIRPEELEELGQLDFETSVSYNTISKLTEIYLEQLAEYYFRFGGDISLVKLLDSVDEFKRLVSNKYRDLFNEHGLDPNKFQ